MIKTVLLRGLGCVEKKVHISIDRTMPNPAILISINSLFGTETIFRLPLLTISDITFREWIDFSPARGAVFAWGASFISSRTSLLGAGLGLRKRKTGVIAITLIRGTYAEEILLGDDSYKKTYKKYVALMKEIGAIQ